MYVFIRFDRRAPYYTHTKTVGRRRFNFQCSHHMYGDIDRVAVQRWTWIWEIGRVHPRDKLVVC
jgi:hypothetical protein